jgi:hypothetical protein
MGTDVLGYASVPSYSPASALLCHTGRAIVQAVSLRLVTIDFSRFDTRAADGRLLVD